MAGATEVSGWLTGRCRRALLRRYERTYPFAWLGILAEARPDDRRVDLLLATSAVSRSIRCDRPRSVGSTSASRPSETLDEWPDDRIWEELEPASRHRRSPEVNEGPIIERSITAMRSVVIEPMRYGRLFARGRRGAHRSADRGQGHESGSRATFVCWLAR